jgi:site-specific DNA-methyltransferase (adenine-specific)
MKPYYEQDGITIYHGDCREVLPSLPEVDHVITDPPYADETHDGALGDGGASKLIDFASVTADDLRVTFGGIRIRRWCVATMDWRHIAAFEKSPPTGLRFVRFGIWVKPNGAPQFTGDRPATGWEGVCILHSDGPKLRWNGGGRHGVWTVNKENTSHPTGKPLALVGGFVQQFTDRGDLILDPFMGGGSVLEACKVAGRRAIGIEREEKYCEIAAKRLAQGVLFGAEKSA